MPLVRRMRATLRSAEFGFFGVWVKTRTQTPRFCGLTCNAGLFVFVTIFLRPWRTSWLIVGINGRGSFLRGHARNALWDRGVLENHPESVQHTHGCERCSRA